jgi:hypothetical protein
MDSRAMIGHIAAKFDVKMSDDDPALIMVEMNRVMLESAFHDVEELMYEANVELKKSVVVVEKANEDFRYSADKIVEEKLREFHEAITTVAENTIKEALGRHVTGEVTKLKGEIGKITSQLQSAIGQTKQSQMVVAGLSGLAGALIATFIGLGAINSGIVTVPDSSTAAAVAQTASNVKQPPKR